jgi:hypothetical protein
MDIAAAFPSKYLSAADLNGRPATVRMGDVSKEVLDREEKLILSFQGKKKQMVLNKTNAMKIAELHGNETDRWYDQVIEIYPAEVEFQGKMTDAIRVRAAGRTETRSDQRPEPRREPSREPARDDRDDRSGGDTMTRVHDRVADDRPAPPRDDRSDFGRGEPPRRVAGGTRADMDDDIPF